LLCQDILAHAAELAARYRQPDQARIGANQGRVRAN
jgi:hypothetical protein